MGKIDPKQILEKDEIDMRDINVSANDCYEMGKNIVIRCRSRGIIHPQIITGGDCRRDTAELVKNFEQGILEQNGIVLSVGHNIPKPLAYVAGEHFQANVVSYFTASHVNAQSNGIKLNALEKNNPFLALSPGTKSDVRSQTIDVYQRYLNEIFGVRGNKQNIIVDTLYGTSSGIAQRSFENAGYKVVSLHDYMDPNFRRLHDNAPDPHQLKNLEQLMECCNKMRCWGVALDGDVDRLSVINETGKKISEDEVTMILAEYMIPRAGKNPKVVYEMKSSNAVPEVIKRSGGIPIMERTGWQNMKKRVKIEKAILAGEVSGHNFYGENFYYVPTGDDGLFTAMMIGKVISETGKNLEALTASFPKYATGPELRPEYKEERNPKIVEHIKESFKQKGYKIIEMGSDIRIEKDSGNGNWSWTVVRASNTEPKRITICFEGNDQENLHGIVNEFIAEIPAEDKELADKIKKSLKI